MSANFVYLEFPSKPENVAFARATVSAFVSQLDPTVPELADISTAVSEATTNIGVHAYPGREGLVKIRAQFVGRQVNIQIEDDGCGVSDPEHIDQFGMTTCSGERLGIGLTLIKACMDHVELKSGKGEGTCLYMSKRLSPQEGGLVND